MREPKLCPYRPGYKTTVVLDGGDDPEKKYKYTTETSEIFGPCLQDKCEMWRAGYFPHVPDNQFQGHCGLAGKP